MILYLVVESAPKRFLLETEGESIGEKQEIYENDDPVTTIPHAVAPSRVSGGMDRMKKQRMKRKNNKGIGMVVCGGCCMIPWCSELTSVLKKDI